MISGSVGPLHPLGLSGANSGNPPPVLNKLGKQEPNKEPLTLRKPGVLHKN
jgi:hypothetical protein